MSNQQIGLLIIGVGILLLLIGFIVWSGGLSWFGHLPGDIHIERPHITIYIPLVSMLLISLALSILLYLIRRFL